MEEDDIGVQVQKKISSSFMLQGTSKWCAVLPHGPNDALTGIHVRKASAYESFSIYVDPVDLQKSWHSPDGEATAKIPFYFNGFSLVFWGSSSWLAFFGLWISSTKQKEVSWLPHILPVVPFCGSGCGCKNGWTINHPSRNLHDK